MTIRQQWMNATVGIVAIGRNEGDRLQACLRSITLEEYPTVYVDSGSTDSSVSFAESLGVEVLNLDMTVPFTAARARNAGWIHLLDLYPNLTFIQFVDGDCIIQPNWLKDAQTCLEARPEALKFASLNGDNVELEQILF